MNTLKRYYSDYRLYQMLAALFLIITIGIAVFISGNHAMFSSDDEFLSSFIIPFLAFVLTSLFYGERMNSINMALKFYNIDLDCKEEVEAKIAELETSEEKTCKC